MSPEDEELLALLSLSEDELFLEISRQLDPPGFYVDKREPKEKIEVGRKWFRERQAQLAKVICSSPVLTAWRAAGEKSTSGIFVAIADLVSGLKLGVAPFTLAAIILKNGLDRLCAGSPTAPSP